jgi:hypothetical protein
MKSTMHEAEEAFRRRQEGRQRQHGKQMSCMKLAADRSLLQQIHPDPQASDEAMLASNIATIRREEHLKEVICGLSLDRQKVSNALLFITIFVRFGV